jgi:hypothetical protein
MKRIFSNILIALFACFVLFILGFFKYKIWRAEHPNAETWTFWVSKK